MPRDREGEFEPLLIARHQREFGDLEGKILSLYARGMSVRDIREHLQDLYGLELSAAFISRLTDRVLQEVKDWQQCPLESVYVTELQSRGVEDILIACVDGLKGFPEAIESIFPQTRVQLCVIHQIRNSLRYISYKDQREFMKDLRRVYQAPTKAVAEEELVQLEKKWGQRYPIVIRSWKSKWEHLSTYFEYSPEIRKLIYTT
ncbi:MAG: transposase, partial [Candidatus Marinimicrobia bacterium]|nr:transposase [Candidatus Neomarinimicrobiota bacterium]